MASASAEALINSKACTTSSTRRSGRSYIEAFFAPKFQCKAVAAEAEFWRSSSAWRVQAGDHRSGDAIVLGLRRQQAGKLAQDD